MISWCLAALMLPPFFAFLWNALWQRKSCKRAGFIAGTAAFIAFASAVCLFFLLLNAPYPQLRRGIPWLEVSGFRASFSFLLDSLSAGLLLVITGVGFLIHIFSIYYMEGDKKPAKYFAYLNLFLFSMMVLVLADNLLFLFAGWEGVGLCSYLLIGFWFQQEEKARAGILAFIVNRVADGGFLLGMLLLFFYTGTLEFDGLQKALAGGNIGQNALHGAAVCFLVAAVGKSAQIPFYIWLPPAMAGPTPVSALIHAATMVTAGVYLISRLGFLFILAPAVLHGVAWIGALSAFWGALAAGFQSDIKKVLAYSTISQLGYMFMALGVGAFGAGVFHLITHACFKALLFLSAGALIHIYRGQQNILQMRGRIKTPLVWGGFLVGGLSLAGLPPFSGFFSKDEILWSAFSSGHRVLFTVGLAAALLTAFYISRLFLLAFYGSKTQESPVHLLNVYAKIPLIGLMLLSVFTGLLGVPHVLSTYLPGHIPHILEDFLKPALVQYAAPVQGLNVSQLARTEFLLMFATSFLILMGAAGVMYLYCRRFAFLLQLTGNRFLAGAGFLNVFYHKVFVQSVWQFSQELEITFEKGLVEGFLKLLQKWVGVLRDSFLVLQNGKMQHYAIYMMGGLVLTVMVFLWG